MVHKQFFYLLLGAGSLSVLLLTSTQWYIATQHNAMSHEVPLHSIFDYNTTTNKPALSPTPASPLPDVAENLAAREAVHKTVVAEWDPVIPGTAHAPPGDDWVIVSKIRHCNTNLTADELAAMASWHLLRPKPTIVVIDECPEALPRFPPNVLPAFHVQYAAIPLLTFGKVRFAVKRAGADLPSFCALAWVDIRFLFDAASAAELSDLVSQLTTTKVHDNLAHFTANPQPSLVTTIQQGGAVGISTLFKFVRTPLETPATFDLDGVREGPPPRFMLWTMPESRLWVPWVAVEDKELVSDDDDDVGWMPSWIPSRSEPTSNDTKRNRCMLTHLQHCDECERQDAFGKTECTSCKHRRFLSYGQCKSKCVSPQIGFGSGKYHRYCALPNERVLTTVATTTVVPLPPVMPEFAAVLAVPPDTAVEQLDSVVLFTIDPTDGVADVIAFSHKSLSDYCIRWGCRTHFVPSHYSAKQKRMANFEQYQVFLELFADHRFANVTTFIYIACGGAIVRPSTDISAYAPRKGSAYDVLFGNMGQAVKVGRPSTAYIAARRSGTALELFSRLAKIDCADGCKTSKRPSTEKFEECCVNSLSAFFTGAVACISEQTPLQVFSSWVYTKVAMEKRSQPLVVQCRGHSCAEHRAVVEPGTITCDWQQQPNVCAARSTVHALHEASARELWQSCSTYVFNGTFCAAADESPDDFARNSYTVVVSTFARDDVLLSNLPHWLACNNVSAVLVVWHNPNREVISRLRRLEKVYKRLTVLQQDTDQLSNRYLRGHQFKTDAVFSVDDDEWYSSAIVLTAFKVWQWSSGEAMVGFSPRRINFSKDSEKDYSGLGYVYDGVCKATKNNAWNFQRLLHLQRSAQPNSNDGPCGHYNTLFVTKGGFLHKRFYRAYFEPVWDAPRASVDEFATAEDILMATVHAARTKPKSLSSASGSTAGATSNAAVIAVTARRRHDADYRGTLSFGELQYQSESLSRDPNSLHFKSEMNRGRARMEIIRNMVKVGLPSPKDHSVWYSIEEQKYIEAADICTLDEGRGCYIF